MKNKIFYIMSLLIISVFCFGEDVVVSNYEGKVMVNIAASQWQPVSVGMLLPENSRIKTYQKSKVILLFSDGSSITLSENTEIGINKLAEIIGLQLESGKVKTKVKPLKLGQVFEIKTPVSVVSIRGTEFILWYENGVSGVIVIEGKVMFSDLLGREIEVNPYEQCQCSAEGIGAKNSVNPADVEGIENEFFKLQDKQQELQEIKKEETKQTKVKEQLKEIKQELKEFVYQAKSDNVYINEIIQQLKEADFSTGRTLIDRHGNLTRVEQTISRPTPETIEFLNITKRNEYVYNGYYKTNLNIVEKKPRIDLFRYTMEFSMKLPQKINELPSFISSHSEDFYLKRMSYELSNTKDKFYGEINFTKDKGSTVKLESQNCWIENANGVVYTIDFDYDENIDGKLPEGRSKDIEDKKLWSLAEIPIPVKDTDGNKDILWVQTEVYLIDNSGKVLDVEYFKGAGSKDIFTVLKEIAVESIVFVRKNSDGTPGEPFFNRNIDLVATPDIIIALAKSLASQATNLTMK